jgi:hypothetical protein
LLNKISGTGYNISTNVSGSEILSLSRLLNCLSPI